MTGIKKEIGNEEILLRRAQYDENLGCILKSLEKSQKIKM